MGRFWRPKWRSKSILERFFFDVFFECVLASILGGFLKVFWRVEPLKIVLPSRRNANSHKIDVFRKSSKKVRKNLDFGVVLGGQNQEKSRKNRVEKHVFFQLRFFSDFFRFFVIFGGFWEAPGGPKINKKLKKSCSGRSWNMFGFERGFQEGSGRVLGRFWEDF